MSRRCGRAENTLIEGAGMHPLDIPTPAALIDETRLMRNIARMQQRMDALGVRLRPHVKTT